MKQGVVGSSPTRLTREKENLNISISFRYATIVDIPQLIAFFDRNLANDWFMAKGKWQKIITGIASDGSRHTPDVCLIAQNDDEIVGIAIMSRYTKKLFNLIIKSDYRNLGIAKEMLTILKPRFIRCKTDMTTGNPIKFYEKLGYIHIGNYDLWGNKTLIGKNKNIAWLEKQQLSEEK